MTDDQFKIPFEEMPGVMARGPNAEDEVRHYDSVGEALKETRKKMQLTHKDIAEELNIRPDVLKKIEANAFDELAGETAVLGFVKSYAGYLELDPAPLVSFLKDEQERHYARIPLPIENYVMPSRQVVLITLFAAVLIFLGVLIYNAQNAPQDDVVGHILEGL